MMVSENNDSQDVKPRTLSPAVRGGLFIFLITVFFFTQYIPQDLLMIQRAEAEESSFSAGLSEMSKSIREGDIKRQIAILLVGLFGVIGLLTKGAGKLKFQSTLGFIIILFLCWAFLSILWSEDVPISFRRLAILVLICLGALAFVAMLSPRDLVSFTFFSTLVYLVISIAAETFYGQFQPLAAGYRFFGIFHPNYQGLNCALLFLSAVFLARNRQEHKFFFYAAATLAFVFLILTKSRTAFIITLLSLVFFWSFTLSFSRWVTVILATIWSLCLSIFLLGDYVLLYLNSMFLLGRSRTDVYTLTGRIPLWEECIFYFEKHPLLGYGYGAFWTPERINAIAKKVSWSPSAAHSVYLDLLLYLGIIGLVIFAMMFLWGLGRALRLYSLSESEEYLFMAVLLVFCILYSFLESTLINPSSMLCFLSMLTFIFLAFKDDQHDVSPGKEEVP